MSPPRCHAQCPQLTCHSLKQVDIPKLSVVASLRAQAAQPRHPKNSVASIACSNYRQKKITEPCVRYSWFLAVVALHAGLVSTDSISPHFGSLSSASRAITASPNWLRRGGPRQSASATANLSWSASCSSMSARRMRPCNLARPWARARNMHRPSPAIFITRKFVSTEEESVLSEEIGNKS
jgi:hypothetical protein